MPSIMDCSGPNLKCWYKNCFFSSITQKGLKIHLSQVHNYQLRDNKARPVKGSRQRRKTPTARGPTLPDPRCRQPYICTLCMFAGMNKEQLARHHQQEHMTGMIYHESKNHHQIRLVPDGAPGSSGASRNRSAARREQTPYMYPALQYNVVARPLPHERPVYEQYFDVNQMPMRSDDFHQQTHAMVQEAMPSQNEQFERGQAYENQRASADWASYRSSVQTPQAMSAEFASTMQNRVDESANAWNSQMAPQRIDDTNMQLWSNVDPMQTLQFDVKRDFMNMAQGLNTEVEPCTQCGCASRGGCSQKVEAQEDVNRIILVQEREQEGGSASNEGDNHEVYHLQADSNFNNLKALLSPGDEIVLECQTEDGREVLLRAVRAGSESVEGTAERAPGVDGLTVALASSTIKVPDTKGDDTVTEENAFTEDSPAAQTQAETSEPTMQSAEESMQSNIQPAGESLPQLFPELFEDDPVNSGLESISWQSGDTEEFENFFEVCKKSEYLSALSNCRGVRDDSGSLFLRCGLCSYSTDMDDALEQLQIHFRRHMDTHFQCKSCEFTCGLREEMVVHVGTQHYAPNNESLF
ncbi:uncharacterized protein LOC100902696 [Galendromus occidentalis]|uniref:Uncharacterized protein LOC100902696 n=1 Tax=Galendromus occidentalis TaxID=34638 RepID=A0AAJ6VYC3_9ACAR|nr:uncharacterized protein LOC100902696 [Galendromus occidentalis]